MVAVILNLVGDYEEISIDIGLCSQLGMVPGG
jgi:hypothetical protein